MERSLRRSWSGRPACTANFSSRARSRLVAELGTADRHLRDRRRGRDHRGSCRGSSLRISRSKLVGKRDPVIADFGRLPAFRRETVIHRLEIPHGRFERRIRLSTGKLRELARSELERGCLMLRPDQAPRMSETVRMANDTRQQDTSGAQERAAARSARATSSSFRCVKWCCSPVSSCRSRSAGPPRSRRRKRRRAASASSASSCRSTRRSRIPKPSQLHRIGTTAQILRYVTSPDGAHHVICRGIRRFRINGFVEGHPYLAAHVEEIGTAEVVDARDRGAAAFAARARAGSRAAPAERAGRGARRDRERSNSASGLADFVAGIMDASPAEKQEVLEALDVKERLDKVLSLLAQRLEVLRLSKQIGDQTQQSLSSQQREHILREQLRQIQKELGEGDDKTAEIAELRATIDKAGMPDEAKSRGRQGAEASRAHAGSGAAEYGMIRTYLDWLIEPPLVGHEPRAHRHRRGAPHPRRGPLRAREGQAAHPRISRGAQAEPSTARARSFASSGRPASARPRSARASRARRGANSRGSASAACMTKRRSAATGAPISARSQATSSSRSARPARAIRC